MSAPKPPSRRGATPTERVAFATEFHSLPNSAGVGVSVAAAILRVSRKTLLRRIEDGTLTSTKFGSLIRLNCGEIRRLLPVQVLANDTAMGVAR